MGGCGQGKNSPDFCDGVEHQPKDSICNWANHGAKLASHNLCRTKHI